VPQQGLTSERANIDRCHDWDLMSGFAISQGEEQKNRLRC
jgi:hypothetical protein